MKKIIYIVITISVCILLIEIVTRSGLAIKVGWRVFLYGTSSYRNTPVLRQVSAESQPPGDVNIHRKGKHSAVGNTDLEVKSGEAGYTKYFPNEAKIDYDEYGEKFNVNINSHGFRGRDFTIDKKPGVIRIVTLGASSTFGYYDRDDETYPAYLEEFLNQNQEGVSFEVINLGIPHLTSAQILDLFQKEGLPLNPNVVTFYEGINDSSLMPDKVWREKLREQEAGSILRGIHRVLGNLSFVRNAYTVARDHMIFVGLIDSVFLSEVLTYSQVDVANHIEGKSARFLANLAVLRDMCQKRGILFVVLTQQARSMAMGEIKGVTYDEESRVIQEKLKVTNRITHQEKTFLTHKILMDDLRAWTQAEHVPLLDVIALLDKDRDVLLSWVHLNPRGNQMIGNALSRKILDELHIVSRALNP